MALADRSGEPIGRDEAEAVLATRAELGPSYDAALAESFADRVEQVVKKDAIKRFIAGGAKGVASEDLVKAIKQEFKEHEDLPNTTNPDDWAKISGKKGERIVYIRTLIASGKEAEGGRSIERVATGQYL